MSKWFHSENWDKTYGMTDFSIINAKEEKMQILLEKNDVIYKERQQSNEKARCKEKANKILKVIQQRKIK